MLNKKGLKYFMNLCTKNCDYDKQYRMLKKLNKKVYKYNIFFIYYRNGFT